MKIFWILLIVIVVQGLLALISTRLGARESAGMRLAVNAALLGVFAALFVLGGGGMLYLLMALGIVIVMWREIVRLRSPQGRP